MKTSKELLKLLKFTANEKANEATKRRYLAEGKEKEQFWFGQYVAFNEFYSIFCDLEKHI